MGEELEFSRTDIEALVANKAWKKIVEDTMGRGLILSEDNDLLDPMSQAATIARNQGEIRAVKWFVDLPRIYADELIDKKEEEQKDGSE
jgi:hypothetical protein